MSWPEGRYSYTVRTNTSTVHQPKNTRYLRYLSKTYLRTVQHVHPHLIVFLGDLLDEGSITNQEDYNEYAQRFHNIFPTGTAKVRDR